MKAVFHTLGCKVNAYDTNEIKKALFSYGVEEAGGTDEVSLIVVNTCCVTNESERKCRQMIRKEKKLHPLAFCVICGCYARTAAESIKRNFPNDLVCVSKDANIIAREIAERFICVSSDSISDSDDNVSLYSDKTRANIKVQDGCAMFCSYCIIPYARGKTESVPLEKVVCEVNGLCERGYSEAVLSGIHLASYASGKNRLIDLIEAIGEKTPLKRLRLGSLEPRLLSEEFLMRAEKVKCLCPHFHISMQSGSDSVLKRMNRRYTSEEYVNICDRVRKHFPFCSITTDVIVGFPAESEEEFLQTKSICERAGFSHVHVFPYSPKKGTPAAEMTGQISNEEKHARAALLIESMKNQSKKVYENSLNECFEVLFESFAHGLYEGYTQNYLPMRAASETDIRGKIVTVKAVSFGDECLYGLVIDENL